MNACSETPTFPAPIFNRPSLPRIAYRIGRYSDFRSSLLGALDRSPLLLGWTHRASDDPGIALLEGAALLGDILTFYQELYANEAWLRTAAWPQSITALVRLTGYRPAPGLGGTGQVAFEITGDSPVTVPSGIAFSAQIAGMAAPADFETAQPIVALPSLNRFALYAASSVPTIAPGQSAFAADAVQLGAAGVGLKAKDRLMLVDANDPARRQVAVVRSVTPLLDQVMVAIAGAWQGSPPTGGVSAWKLGRTFRAFGYNAPALQFGLDAASALTSTPVDTTLTLDSLLLGFPLERQVDDLGAGITMLLELQVSDLGGTPTDRFEALTALSVRSDHDAVGPLQGGITRVAFEQGGVGTGPYHLVEWVDRRTAVCHEVSGQGFALNGVRSVANDAGTDALDHFGDGASYAALDGRTVQFVALDADDTAARVEEARVAIDRSRIGDATAVALRRVTLAPGLAQFGVADFPLVDPAVVVFGNVAPMTQGKSQAQVSLGNGDARQRHQSFQLPKAPLTWLADESLAPPRAAAVTVLVDQIAWQPVDTLFASGPRDQVYILREDAAGNTWIQFGDGVNGAVLSSGVGNVQAVYRTGNGANGSRRSGAKPQAAGNLPNLGQLRLYDEVTGGSVDEEASHARTTAPGRVQELGRVVSLSDFEFEALSLPGVEKALAAWDIDDNVPLLALTVLLADDTPAQLASVQSALSAANADRGAARFAVLATRARLEYVQVALALALRPGYQPEPVLAALTAALGVLPADGSAAPAGGVFSVDARDLGEAEYASRIEGALQNVDGVAWVEVTAFGALGVADDPSTLTPASPAALSPAVACAGDRVLALYAAHFSASLGTP